MNKKIMAGVVAAIGVAFTGMAFFALQLGIGHSSQWGPGRKIVAAVGMLLIMVSFLMVTWNFWRRALGGIGDFINRFLASLFRLPPFQRLSEASQARFNACKIAWDRSRLGRWFGAYVKPSFERILMMLRRSRIVRYYVDSQDHMAALVAAVLGIAVIIVYVWFVSVGRWTDWPKSSSYYQELADAFRQGQVSLLIQPDPRLLELADPYTLSSRGNLPYQWDVVLYNGKFYLYWGPGPALIMTAVQIIYRSEIDDQVLVFTFVSGAFLFSSLLILHLRRKFFPSLKWPYVIPGVLMAGFANPLPWLLNRPAVYEAAIAAGQFFLLAALYFIIVSLERIRLNAWLLALAGICLAMTIASRVSLALAAVFLILMTAWKIFIMRPGMVRFAVSCVALGLPFAIGLGGMGLYNQVRFGLWFEFGHRYQLTITNFNTSAVHEFSFANLLSNLHNYVLNPFRTLSVFPFVKPEWGGHFVFFVIRTPNYYRSEQISGLIPTFPYVILILVPILYLLWRGWRLMAAQSQKGGRVDAREGNGSLEWIAGTLSGVALLAFGPVLLFITATMRYLADAVPLLVLLSTLGFWMCLGYLEKKPALRGLFVTLVIGLTLYSVIVSLLLAVTGYDMRFEKLNPALFDRLTHLLTP